MLSLLNGFQIFMPAVRRLADQLATYPVLGVVEEERATNTSNRRKLQNEVEVQGSKFIVQLDSNLQ